MPRQPAWLLVCTVAAVSMASGRFVGRAVASPNIASTPELTPEQEKAKIHLPPGFEIQLVASEPEIHKPININFDDRGRLWITDTVEYPFPVAPGAPSRDTVKVLEDFAPDGHARKITTFADNLNIPVGVMPLPTPPGPPAADPRGMTVIAHSIPNVWKFIDATGAGKADQRSVLLSGIGHDDTHGLTGSFTEGFDGWVYACHGFRNTSNVKGTDGSEIVMNSGNTYRFRPDGSRVQHFTHGQVNPFGLAWDPLGNLYSSDCETKPIYMLIPEAYYPSFGKPDDGLGFAPLMCDHLYGSTAIAGLVDYVAPNWPAEYQGTMFIGNVVTNVVNHCRLSPRGSWFHADDLPDFCVSDDPWFRPVNLKLGPDGALYIADFYNRIIGHYEVDLHNPGRDKQRGRIWRIVYHGQGAQTPPEKMPDLSIDSPQQLVDALADANLTIRMMATSRLADEVGAAAIAPARAALSAPKNPEQAAHALWVLHRLNALDAGALAAAAHDKSPLVRVHAMRVLGDIDRWDADDHALALGGLGDDSPMVQRCAAETLSGPHADPKDLRAMLDLRERAPAADTYLIHTVRIALRDELARPGAFAGLPLPHQTHADENAIMDVVAGIEGPEAAGYVIHQLAQSPAGKLASDALIQHAARYAPPAELDDLAKLAQSRFADDLGAQFQLYQSIATGLQQRGEAPPAGLRDWGKSLATQLLATPSTPDPATEWANHPLPDHNQADPWVVQVRASDDGNKSAAFFTSFPKGESLTGSLRSPDFPAPAELSFYLAGQDGPPSVAIQNLNAVTLRAVDTGETLMRAPVPRNDVARKVTWDLKKLAGRRVYFEATDANSGPSWAWLAFGRFEPAVVKIPPLDLASREKQVQSALEIAGTLKLTELTGAIARTLLDSSAPESVRAAAAKSLASFGSADLESASTLGKALTDSSAPPALRESIAGALGNVNSDAARAQLTAAFKTAPQSIQRAIALGLAGTREGAEALLSAVAAGKASPRLLTDAGVRTKLDLAKPADLAQRVSRMTRGIVTADQAVQKLIDSRAAAFERIRLDPARASAARGAQVFAKNCMVCHSIAGQGAHVGPQLDGVGTRGPERLCEDILDPSRNVDAAFRETILTLDNGDVLVGLQRREEGEAIVFADGQGKEFTVPKKQIVKRVESQLSLMPANFGDLIAPADFDNLLAFLLTK